MQGPLSGAAHSKLPPNSQEAIADLALLNTEPWRFSTSHPLYYVVYRISEVIGQYVQNIAGTALQVLDFGCGNKPYRKLFPPGADYCGADIAGNPVADTLIDADGRLGLPDGSRDLVLSTQVLEHVTSPEIYLAESYRVLKPGGRLILSTHGIWPYHAYPVDFWRWTGTGLQKTVSAAGFRIERFEGIMGMSSVGLHLLVAPMYHHIPRWVRPLFSAGIQKALGFLDRRHSAQARRRDAAVYALVAVKPD